MHGNVWEWTADWYNANYPTGNSVIDPTGPNLGSSRVFRGGSWYGLDHSFRSAGVRNKNSPSFVSGGLGFRVGFQYNNNPPFDLNFTAPLTIAENQPIGTMVGEFRLPIRRTYTHINW